MNIGLSDSTIEVQHYDESDGVTPAVQYTALVQSWKVPMEAEAGTICVDPDDLPVLVEALLAAIEWWGLRSIQADKIEHDGRTYFLALCSVCEDGDAYVVSYGDTQLVALKLAITPELREALERHCKR